MLLHKYNEEFRELITIVAHSKNLPESAVERDYYIVLLLHIPMKNRTSIRRLLPLSGSIVF